MKKEMRQNLVFWFAVGSTALTFIAFVILVVAQIYVRWKLNQNFTFLGDMGLLSLSTLLLGQTLGLLYYVRS